MTTGEKLAEEAKRDRAWGTARRWEAFEAAIAFVEENLPPERRRNRPRWHPDQEAGPEENPAPPRS